MKKILFPTDFSNTAQNAFVYALKLAEALDAELDLMHVYHITAGEAGKVNPRQIDEMLKERKEEALEKLHHFIEPLPDAF